MSDSRFMANVVKNPIPSGWANQIHLNAKRWRSALVRGNQLKFLSRLVLVFGGAEGDRTPDLMTASHALSQLSYGPRQACAD